MNDWHVPQPVWRAYRDGALDVVAEASVEAHLTSCEHCRSLAAEHAAPDQLDLVWKSIVADVRRPALPRRLSWLRRFGVPEEDLVLLSAGEGLVMSWAVAVGSVLVTVLITSMAPVQAELIFMFAAPVIPVIAIAAAFEATDPLRALSASTPSSKLRIALVRTVASLAVAVPATMATGLAVPALGHLAFSWLLPALLLATAVLALMTWLEPWTATGAVAIVWAVVVLAANVGDRLDALHEAPAQLSFFGVGVVLAAVFAARSISFGTVAVDNASPGSTGGERR